MKIIWYAVQEVTISFEYQAQRLHPDAKLTTRNFPDRIFQ